MPKGEIRVSLAYLVDLVAANENDVFKAVLPERLQRPVKDTVILDFGETLGRISRSGHKPNAAPRTDDDGFHKRQGKTSRQAGQTSAALKKGGELRPECCPMTELSALANSTLGVMNYPAFRHWPFEIINLGPGKVGVVFQVKLLQLLQSRQGRQVSNLVAV